MCLIDTRNYFATFRIKEELALVDFCSSNVLWFVNGCVGPDGLAHITSRDVAIEFGVAEERANEELSRLCEANFVRLVPSGAYEILQGGKDECAFLAQFVDRGRMRKVNPHTAIKIARKLRAWFPGKSPDEIFMNSRKLKLPLSGRSLNVMRGSLSWLRR